MFIYSKDIFIQQQIDLKEFYEIWIFFLILPNFDREYILLLTVLTLITQKLKQVQ